MSSFPYIPRSRIAGSYGTSIFNLFRKLPTVFHNGCTNLHFHQQCTRVPFLHIVTDSYLFVFLIIAILTGDRSLWFLFAFLWLLVILSIFSCISWPFGCLLWKNVYSVPLPILNWSVCYLMLSCMSYLCIFSANPLSNMVWKYSFHYVGCAFILLIFSFCTEAL